MQRHHWPGNVRELENVLVQGILYSEGDTIRRANIPVTGSEGSVTPCTDLDRETGKLPYKEAKEKTLTQFNHNYIGAMLTMTGGNITQAAKRCAMDRQALQQIMKRYAIDPDQFRGN